MSVYCSTFFRARTYNTPTNVLFQRICSACHKMWFAFFPGLSVRASLARCCVLPAGGRAGLPSEYNTQTHTRSHNVRNLLLSVNANDGHKSYRRCSIRIGITPRHSNAWTMELQTSGQAGRQAGIVSSQLCIYGR